MKANLSLVKDEKEMLIIGFFRGNAMKVSNWFSRLEEYA